MLSQYTWHRKESNSKQRKNSFFPLGLKRKRSLLPPCCWVQASGWSSVAPPGIELVQHWTMPFFITDARPDSLYATGVGLGINGLGFIAYFSSTATVFLSMSGKTLTTSQPKTSPRLLSHTIVPPLRRSCLGRCCSRTCLRANTQPSLLRIP